MRGFISVTLVILILTAVLAGLNTYTDLLKEQVMGYNIGPLSPGELTILGE